MYWNAYIEIPAKMKRLLFHGRKKREKMTQLMYWNAYIEIPAKMKRLLFHGRKKREKMTQLMYWNAYIEIPLFGGKGLIRRLTFL